MKFTSSLRTLPVALLASALVVLGLAGPASAYTAQDRVSYFNSGKYGEDLNFVAKKAKKWIKKSSKKTLPTIRACEKAGFRQLRLNKMKAPGKIRGIIEANCILGSDS